MAKNIVLPDGSTALVITSVDKDGNLTARIDGDSAVSVVAEVSPSMVVGIGKNKEVLMKATPALTTIPVPTGLKALIVDFHILNSASTIKELYIAYNTSILNSVGIVDLRDIVPIGGKASFMFPKDTAPTEIYIKGQAEAADDYSKAALKVISYE